ncbi:G-protein coupled receptor Mth2 [Manduca sexta]|uniref:G-protein coupled receptor Mth2 n=1 Tax=Manduca sexta TaxID=7130 RepID=UPI001890264E|nr:G-protein coupled receptor Mth2 [Manduca sexta]
MMLSIFLFMFILLRSSALDVRECCSDGEVILPIKQGHYCWDKARNTTSNYTLVCKEYYITLARFNVSDTGALLIPLRNKSFEHTGDFCVGTQITNLSQSKLRPLAILCSDEEDQIIDDHILGYCMIVSVIFLAITAGIYTALPELRDLQGKSIINFCISLAIGLSILTIMKIMEYSDMNLCAVRGFLAYFFMIASFFWTNAISIQVLITTRQPNMIADYRWKYFIWYALYAWGVPILLTTAMAIVNFHPGDHEKPGIGLNHCWFFSKALQWAYMYSIMTILLIANICIFIYISRIIWKTRFTSSHLKIVRYKFMMTIRLVILMGIPWVTEMISSLMPNTIIWTIVDVFNTLQGFLIFLVLVVFRLRVIKAMHAHGWLCCFSKHVDKHLAAKEDDEDNVIQHTELPTMDT